MACVCAWFISLDIELFRIIYDIWRSMRQGMCCHPGQVLKKVIIKQNFSSTITGNSILVETRINRKCYFSWITETQCSHV